MTSNLTKCHVQSEVTTVGRVKTVNLEAASRPVQDGCAHRYRRHLRSPRTRLEETAPVSPQHPPTSAGEGRVRGGEDDGKAMSSSAGKRLV